MAEEEATEITEQRVLMIAVDNSRHSEAAFDWCMNNMFKDGDKLLIFHCHELHYPSFPQALGTDEWKQIVAQHEKKLKELEAKYKAKCEEAQKSARIVVHGGSAGHAICGCAEKEHVSCVVIGSRGLGTIRRTILGSVSDYVLHHAHVPVVVVPKVK